MSPTADDRQDEGERRVLVPKFSEIAVPDPQEGFRLLEEMRSRGVPPDIIMQTISALAAREKCIQQFQQMSRYNEKTGLFSRAGLEEQFPHMQAALRRVNHDRADDKKLEGVLAFADIVRMSGFNKHGHHIGDAAIYAMSVGLQKLCHRDGDMAARLNSDGDEFVLGFNMVTPDFYTDRPDRESTLKTGMRKMQRGLFLETPNGPENIGIRYHTVTFNESSDLAELLQLADPKHPQNVSKVVTFDPIANQPGTSTAPPPAAPGASIA